MKQSLLFLISTFVIFSCALPDNEPDYLFEAEYKQEIIRGITQIQNFSPDTLFIRGLEDGDGINGRFLTVYVDEYTGRDTYAVSSYSFDSIVEGDTVINIGTSTEPFGQVTVTTVTNNVVEGSFSGEFISSDSTETFNIKATFKVLRDF